MLIALSFIFMNIKKGNTEVYVTEVYSEEDYARLIKNVYEENERIDESGELCVYENIYVSLHTDIDYSKVQSMLDADIAPELENFGGIFDGNGYKICNLQIDSEDRACLFYRLYGTVANLVIDDSCAYKADKCAMIALYPQNSARIINCAGYAQITADDDYNLFSGDDYVGKNIVTKTDIAGMTGNEREGLIEKLNSYALNYNEDYSVACLNRWELVDGCPVISQDKYPRVKFSYIESSRGKKYNAFYSEKLNEWVLVLPKDPGTSVYKIQAQISFPDKTSNVQLNLSEDKNTNIDIEGYKYDIKVMHPEACEILYLDTLLDDNFNHYINQYKGNVTEGTAYLINQTGNQKAFLLEKLGGRGNTSWEDLEKKGYNIKLSEDEELVEGELCREYALIAAQKDNSLLTYVYNGELNKRLNWDFAPTAKLMHLYTDGDYRGVYYVTPKVEIGKNRFDLNNLEEKTKILNKRELYDYNCIYEENPISETETLFYQLANEPDDITGGYIIELNAREQYPDYAARFVTDSGATYVIRSMRYAGEKQVGYIHNFWQEFENAIKSPDGINENGYHYSEYIDVHSLCKQFLQFEMYGEISLKASIYFYKDSDSKSDGKIYASYPWDVEHSMYQTGYGILGDSAEHNLPYWEDIKRRPELRDTMSEIWQNEMRNVVVDFFDGQKEIPEATQLYELYKEDLKINNARWSEDDAERKYEEIVSFMSERVNYMDELFGVKK